MKITPLNPELLSPFTSLFGEYYRELDCEDDAVQLIEEYILPDCEAGLIGIDILEDDGNPVGFIIYQIDDIDNDWNFKEGWGDIREIYVVRSLRRKGLGKLLLNGAESKLKERGANNFYALPTNGAVPFFTACGYIKTDGYNEELDCPVFEK